MKTNEIRHIISGMLVGCMMSTVAVGQSIYKYVMLRVSGNGYSDETVIRFVPGAKEGYDAYDSYKLPNGYPNPNLSTIADSNDLVNNSIPLLDHDMDIPVRLRVGVSGEYMIELVDVFFAPAGIGIAMEDKTLRNWVNLRERSYYTFTISDTTTEPRFALHLYSASRVAKRNVSCFASGDGYITAKGAGKGPWNYSWTNIGSAAVSTILNHQGSDKMINLSAGGYIVNIQDNSEVFLSTTDTVFITEPQPLNTSAYKQHVSCKSGSDGRIDMIVSGGTAPFQFLWSTGDTTKNIDTLSVGQYILNTTDHNGCTRKDSVRIYEHDSIIAGFITASDTTYLSDGGLVHFTNASSGGNSLYTWDFGDGSPQGFGAEVFHTYISKGIYEVKLVASNVLCADTTHREITVLAGPSFVKDHDKGKEFVEIKIKQRSSVLEIAIIAEEPVKGTVHIIDIAGRLIFMEEKVWKLGETPIEISSAISSPGILFVEFATEGFAHSRKIAFIPLDGVR